MDEFNDITTISKEDLESTLKILKGIDPENDLILDIVNELDRREYGSRLDKYRSKYLGKYVKLKYDDDNFCYCKVDDIEEDDDRNIYVSSHVFIIFYDCEEPIENMSATIETYWPDASNGDGFIESEDKIEIISEEEYTQILNGVLYGKIK